MRLTLSFRESVCLILAVVSPPCMATGTADVAAQYHCAGSAQLAGNTNLVTLNKGFALRSAPAVWKLAMTRISGLLANSFHLGTNASTASLIEPLLSDVVESESFASFGGSSTNFLGFVLALRLDEKRAQLWQDNLGKAFGRPGEKLTMEEFNGWRWRMGASDSFWIIPARDWLLVGRGDDLLPVQVEYLRQVSRNGQPSPALTDNWLEADLDCPRLAAWLPDWLRLAQLARIKIRMATETNNLHMTARVIYPETIPWKSGSWQPPVEFVSGPLVSFTVGQNIAAFLNLDPVFFRLDGNPFTNQFYAWGMSGLPFLTYMAWPVPNATNVMEELSTNAPAVFNPGLKQFNGTQLAWQTRWRRLVLMNLRVILPYLEAAQGNAGEYLLAALLPPPHMKEPVPHDLWKPVNGRTNLVYYDWERTGTRLQQWRMLGRMLLTRSRALTDEMLGAQIHEERWLGALAPLVGDGETVTEITRVAPDELAVVRNSPIGFTGIELYLLSEWLSTIGAAPTNSQPPAFKP